MSNDLTQSKSIVVIPSSVDDVMRIGKIISDGGFAPKGNDSPQQIIAAIQKGIEVGLSPMAAVQNIAVIGGKPCLWGDAMIALVESSGFLSDIVEEIQGEGENRKAVCTVERKGRKTPTTRTFSVKDAKTAGLWGRNVWAKYPDRMLQMRARGFALRDTFADVLNGLHIREEILDYARIEIPEERIEDQKPLNIDFSDDAPQIDATEPEVIITDIEPEEAEEAAQPDLLPEENPFQGILDLMEAASKLGTEKYNEYLAGLPNDAKGYVFRNPTKEGSYYLICLDIAEAVDKENIAESE